MSITGVFTTGRDGQMVISVAGFGNITPPLGTTFHAQQRYKKVRSEPISGPPIEVSQPDGWEWEIGMDRGNRVPDDIASALDATMWAGGTLPQCVVTLYIKENDNSTSTYAFAAGSVEVMTGTYTPDQPVKQKLSGFSSTRRKVS